MPENLLQPMIFMAFSSKILERKVDEKYTYKHTHLNIYAYVPP